MAFVEVRCGCGHEFGYFSIGDPHACPKCGAMHTARLGTMPSKSPEDAEFGRRIRAARRSMGLYLDQAAQRTGIDMCRLSDLEGGYAMAAADERLRLDVHLGVLSSGSVE